MKKTKRVVVFAVTAVVASMTLFGGGAFASNNCPGDSIYKGGRAGGVCVDPETGDVVKEIRNTGT